MRPTYKVGVKPQLVLVEGCMSSHWFRRHRNVIRIYPDRLPKKGATYGSLFRVTCEGNAIRIWTDKTSHTLEEGQQVNIGKKFTVIINRSKEQKG